MVNVLGGTEYIQFNVVQSRQERIEEERKIITTQQQDVTAVFKKMRRNGDS